MHIYAFGSLCRGEFDHNSDVDLLALTRKFEPQLDPQKFSIYSYEKIKSLWNSGSPFAWHLFLESRLLFAPDGVDFLQSLGRPARYSAVATDCMKFRDVFADAIASLREGTQSQIFDMSSIFLSIRNIATCFSLGVLGIPCFSRHAGLSLRAIPLPLPAEQYRILERSRILCTRGTGIIVSPQEMETVRLHFEAIQEWMGELVRRAEEHERV